MFDRFLLLLLVILNSFINGHFVEFGLKLVEFRGFQDDLILGKVFLHTEVTSREFKELVSKCLEDYINSDVRPAGPLEGTIKTIGSSDRSEMEHLYGLTGDVANFQNYLETMIHVYYQKKYLKIQFSPIPILRQRRAKQAKIGEIVNLEYCRVYTTFDDPLVDFLVSFGDGSNNSGSSNLTDGPTTPLLSRDSSNEERLCGCGCCTIS